MKILFTTLFIGLAGLTLTACDNPQPTNLEDNNNK